jgi:hypothetical protein
MDCDIRLAASDFNARRLLMSRDGAIIFADLIGKLDVLYVHCPKCRRAGRYHVQHLIDERGRNALARLTQTYILTPASHSSELAALAAWACSSASQSAALHKLASQSAALRPYINLPRHISQR